MWRVTCQEFPVDVILRKLSGCPPSKSVLGTWYHCRGEECKKRRRLQTGADKFWPIPQWRTACRVVPPSRCYPENLVTTVREGDSIPRLQTHMNEPPDHNNPACLRHHSSGKRGRREGEAASRPHAVHNSRALSALIVCCY